MSAPPAALFERPPEDEQEERPCGCEQQVEKGGVGTCSGEPAGEAAEDAAGDADEKGHAEAARVPARVDCLRQRAGNQPDDDPAEETVADGFASLPCALAGLAGRGRAPNPASRQGGRLLGLGAFHLPGLDVWPRTSGFLRGATGGLRRAPRRTKWNLGP